MTQPLSMLRFSTPAECCGVQSDYEPPRSTIAARNALGRMSQHRRDWRAATFHNSQFNLARREADPIYSTDSTEWPVLIAGASLLLGATP